MSTTNNEARLIKNEQLIRDQNVSSGKGIKRYFRGAKAVAEAPVAFICECSILNCDEHVSLSIKEYMHIHQRADRFVVFPGHEIKEVEKNVQIHDEYIIVEKFSLPNQPTPGVLQP